MKPTHRLNKGVSICGDRGHLAEGTEVEMLRESGQFASVKPSDDVVQLVKTQDLDPIEGD